MSEAKPGKEQTEAPAESEFTKFVRAIFAVPKAAVEKAEAMRPKRRKREVAKSAK